MVEILEVIDDEIKLEEKQFIKELQVNFIGMKNVTINMEFSLAYAHHKLNFEVHQSRTCFNVNMVYSKYYSSGVESSILDR